MLEWPEAQVIARQLNQCIKGKSIKTAVAARTAHKLTWYNGDPREYGERLSGRVIGESAGRGALVVVQAEPATLSFSDGINLRYHAQGEARPAKHQLVIEFTDGSALSAVTQMYGGVACFLNGVYDNPYFQAAIQKPDPLSPAFSLAYFKRLAGAVEVQKLSLKAFLATQQRIPGVGNGVLQDILFRARRHPKIKVGALSPSEIENLYKSVVSTLANMAKNGGRDTEKDLFGKNGGYISQMSKNSVRQPCPVCGTIIVKEAYLGGSVYFCPGCQKV
jgi:formamidopyrimidine-DNA glycosylase